MLEAERPLRVVAIVPVLNEQETIAGVVAGLKQYGADEVIVVDNGCSDSSAERARAASARVVREPARGYGRACSRGLREAASYEPDVVVFADGDGCDVLEDLPAVLGPVLSGALEMVVGARIAIPPLPWHVRAGNRAATLLLHLLFGARYGDLGPLRAVRWDALHAMALREGRCGWTVEMQARAALLHMRTGEVRVRYRPRTEGSKISGTVCGSVIAGYDILRALFRVALMREPRCD